MSASASTRLPLPQGDTPTREETAFARAVSPANPHVLVIAHRGDWSGAPENSLAAVRGAVALGLDMVEIDVRLAADGVPVVIHDASLDRTTDGSGPVAARTSSELRRLCLRAGEGGPDAALTDERLPTLAELLEETHGRILVNLDTKSPAELPEIARIVAGMGLAGEVVVKSEIDPLSVDALPADHPAHGALPFMPILTTGAGRIAADVEALAQLKPLMVECHPERAETLVDGRAALEAAGIRLWVNAIDCSHIPGFNDSRALADPDAVWGQLVAWGAGAIQTDRGAELVAYLTRIGRRA